MDSLYPLAGEKELKQAKEANKKDKAEKQGEYPELEKNADKGDIISE